MQAHSSRCKPEGLGAHLIRSFGYRVGAVCRQLVGCRWKRFRAKHTTCRIMAESESGPSFMFAAVPIVELPEPARSDRGRAHFIVREFCLFWFVSEAEECRRAGLT